MPERVSDGERLLGELLEMGHALRPDEIPRVTADIAVRLGARDAAVYLADIEQRWLIPFGRDSEPLDIDGTVAGRGFRARETVESEGGVWHPLLDGADRIGMLHASLPADADDALRRRLGWLASIVAQLVVTKSKYGDVIVRASRMRPVALATELRWMLLPPLTFRNDHVEMAGMLEPAYAVAGDAFDYAVGPDDVHFAVFDAMGHGLESTRMANLAIAAYRHARRELAPLEDIVARIDTVLADQFGPERFVTALLATLDLHTGLIRLVCAGHPLPLHLRGTKLVGQLSGPVNVPLGLGIRDVAVLEVSLEPGDRLLLFSDGVTEAQSPDGTLFGVERLGELLTRAAMAGELPAETVRRLTHSVLEHAGEVRDDATLLLVGWPQPR